MSLVIIGDAFTFPEGNAATNRVHTYAKGFHENGLRVHVICFRNSYNNEGDGIFNGINFYHPFGKRKRSRYLLVRQWYKFLKYYQTIKLIRTINKKNRIIAFNSWTNILLTQLFIFIIARFLGTNVVNEHSEHPMRNYQGNRLRKTQGVIRIHLDSMMGNGVFCISQYLIDFYIAQGISPRKLFLVPSTVDTDRFKNSVKSPFPFQYILYCGSLSILKDGVNILIESFRRLTENNPDINLVLIGKGDNRNEEIYIKALVERLNIKERVFFMGQLPRTEIPAFLKNARVLALARPKSMVADAGFPSKLTEYLTTGIPVVVTGVGEIPLYLQDNKNAFLSEPDSIDAFSARLKFVLDNYNFAREVALKGKELTDTIFNYKFQADRMIGFINSLG